MTKVMMVITNEGDKNYKGDRGDKDDKVTKLTKLIKVMMVTMMTKVAKVTKVTRLKILENSKIPQKDPYILPFPRGLVWPVQPQHRVKFLI